MSPIILNLHLDILNYTLSRLPLTSEQRNNAIKLIRDCIADNIDNEKAVLSIIGSPPGTPNIIEQGYRPEDKLDTSNPPEDGSAVYNSNYAHQKEEKNE